MIITVNEIVEVLKFWDTELKSIAGNECKGVKENYYSIVAENILRKIELNQINKNLENAG